MQAVSPPSVEEFIASLPLREQELARHVLLGDFNKKTGRPVGFHHAPNGVAPPGRRIDRVLERFADGSYSAVVSFYHPGKRVWVQKRLPHTMFPNHWTSEQVMAAGREAYAARMDQSLKRWNGWGRGVPIGGWRRRGVGRPDTFFPDYGR